VKRFFELLKSALVSGLIIVVPAWLAILLLIQLLVKLGVLVKPISSHMPRGLDHPQIVAGLVFLLICLLVGFIVHTAIGRLIGRTLGRNVFNRVPGYQSLRNIARQFADMDARDGFKPALIEVEDGSLAPAFLIELHEGGQGTVFLPSVPTPMAGSIFIMPMERIHPIDVPVTTMMKCISKWGAGSGELLDAMKRAKHADVGIA
jgi:uncharacterized membrane protein